MDLHSLGFAFSWICIPMNCALALRWLFTGGLGGLRPPPIITLKGGGRDTMKARKRKARVLRQNCARMAAKQLASRFFLTHPPPANDTSIPLRENLRGKGTQSPPIPPFGVLFRRSFGRWAKPKRGGAWGGRSPPHNYLVGWRAGYDQSTETQSEGFKAKLCEDGGKAACPSFLSYPTHRPQRKLEGDFVPLCPQTPHAR